MNIHQLILGYRVNLLLVPVTRITAHKGAEKHTQYEELDIEVIHCTQEKYTQTIWVINVETVKITGEIHPGPSSQQLEINNNLLVTFFLFFLSPESTESEREDRMKKVCVWPWKLIKNRCGDNHIKVMEALCARAAYILCV